MRYYGDGSRFQVDTAYLYQEKLHGMPFAINLARSWIGECGCCSYDGYHHRAKDAFTQLLAHPGARLRT